MDTFVVKVLKYKKRFAITLPLKWKRKHLKDSNLYLFTKENKDGTLTLFTEDQWYESKVNRNRHEGHNKTGEPIKKPD